MSCHHVYFLLKFAVSICGAVIFRSFFVCSLLFLNFFRFRLSQKIILLIHSISISDEARGDMPDDGERCDDDDRTIDNNNNNKKKTKRRFTQADPSYYKHLQQQKHQKCEFNTYSFLITTTTTATTTTTTTTATKRKIKRAFLLRR